MKRVMVLFGSAGCRVAQSVVYAACAGAWSGETDVLLVCSGADAEQAQRTSLLFGQYGRVRAAVDALPGEKLGFTVPLRLTTWPAAMPWQDLNAWAAGGDDALLCRALFTRAEADCSLQGSMPLSVAKVAFAGLLQGGDRPLDALEEYLKDGEVRVLLAGALADGWSAAGITALSEDILRRARPCAQQLKLGVAALFPYAGHDEQAHRRAAMAVNSLAHSGTVYTLGLNESDSATAQPDQAHVVEWLAATCADSFFRAQEPPQGLMSYRVGPGKLGWESFPAAYRVCYGSLMKTAAAFRLTFAPVIRRGLTTPRWLRDKMIGWYAGYFRQAPKMTDEQRDAVLASLDDVNALLDGCRTWMNDMLRNLPPLLRSSGAMDQARQEAEDNYRQYVETAGQLTVMLREAEESGLAREKTVHRHDMQDNEAEKMQKLFQQIDLRRQALAARQVELNRRIGGAAQMLMMKATSRRLKAESADLHQQAEEAARRIDEAARVASVEEQHRIATARTKLQRMERYMAQVDAGLALVREERARAKAEHVRAMPAEIVVESTLPESSLFDPAALDCLAGLPAQDDGRSAKRPWAEAESAWSGLVLPLKGSECSLQELAARMKTKEEHASPVAALLRDVMIATVKEVR